MEQDIENKILSCITEESFENAKEAFKKMISDLATKSDQKRFIDILNQKLEEGLVLKTKFAIQLISIGKVENIDQINKFLSGSFNRVRNLVADRSIQKMENFDRVGDKEAGVTDGFVAESNEKYGYSGQKFMMKSLDTDLRQGVVEYIVAPIFNMILYGKAPEIQLVDCDDGRMYIRSKYFDKSYTLHDFLKRNENKTDEIDEAGEIDEIVGLEKVYATSIALGDHDYGDRNVVIFHDRERNKYEAAKIDHGCALCSYHNYVHKLLSETKGRAGRCKLGANEFVEYFSNAIKFLKQDDLIDDILSERIINLQKSGILLENLNDKRFSGNDFFVCKNFSNLSEDEKKEFKELCVKPNPLYSTEGKEKLNKLLESMDLLSKEKINLEDERKKLVAMKRDREEGKYEDEKLFQELKSRLSEIDQRKIECSDNIRAIEKCIQTDAVGCKVMKSLNYILFKKYIQDNIRERVGIYDKMIDELRIMQNYTEAGITNEHLDENKITKINISINNMNTCDPILFAFSNGLNIVARRDDGKYIVQDPVSYAQEIGYFSYDRVLRLTPQLPNKELSKEEKLLLCGMFAACNDDVKLQICDGSLEDVFIASGVDTKPKKQKVRNNIKNKSKMKKVINDSTSSVLRKSLTNIDISIADPELKKRNNKKGTAKYSQLSGGKRGASNFAHRRGNNKRRKTSSYDSIQ